MGWVAHRLLVPCSVLGVAVKPVLLTYLLWNVPRCGSVLSTAASIGGRTHRDASTAVVERKGRLDQIRITRGWWHTWKKVHSGPAKFIAIC